MCAATWSGVCVAVVDEEDDDDDRKGGRNTHPGATSVYRPIETATVCLAPAPDAGATLLLEPALWVVVEGAEAGAGRTRSPRITALAWIAVRPPRIMLAVPWIWERREILLPVSVRMYSLLGARAGAGARVEVGRGVGVGVGGGLGAGMVGWLGGWLLVRVVRGEECGRRVGARGDGDGSCVGSGRSGFGCGGGCGGA